MSEDEESVDGGGAVDAVRFSVPPQKIACGFYHSAAISNCESSAGKTEAWCWGRNQNNALGLASLSRRSKASSSTQPSPADAVGTADRKTPARVASLRSDIYEVACGVNHTVFLKKKPGHAGGVLFASGLGTRGRLGAPNPEGIEGKTEECQDAWFSREGPLQTRFNWQSGTRVLRVVCGSDHTICYATNRHLYAWGANTDGQCGVGHLTDVKVPAPVLLSKDKPMLHFSAGALHSLAAVGDHGELWTWGCGRNGRLGLGSTATSAVPVQVAGAGQECIVVVEGGEAHSGALTVDGEVLTWGAGSYGRLGHGEDADLVVPRRVHAFREQPEGTDIKIASLALGGFHSLFLEDRNPWGRLFACGSGAAVGCLGENDRFVIWHPRPVGDPRTWSGSRITQIAAGMFHSLVLLQNGDLVSWGVGGHGRLGDGKDKNLCEPQILKWNSFRGFESIESRLWDESERSAGRIDTKVSQQGPKTSEWEVAQFGCGALHTVARTHGGQVYTWGCNANGQLGLGEQTTYSWVPRKLSLDRLVKELAVGYEHCLVVTMTQELWSWGKGTDGQLGIGFARDAFEPVQVTALSQVVSCSAGEVHSAAILKNCTQLWTWGSAESGMLGLGHDYISGAHSTPMKVEFPPFGGARQVASGDSVGPISVRCGQSHTAVIVGRTDNGLGTGAPQTDFPNQVWTFGGGWYGRLGIDSTSNIYSPRQVNMRGAVAREVSCGAYHTCALTMEGELYVWGRGKMVCEPEDVRVPKKFVHIEGQPKLKLVACGETHTLVVSTAGELFVWGDNKVGQLGLGLGSRADVVTPDQAKLFPGAVDMLATGPGHTIALFLNGDTYAWGNQSCGRLGLAEKRQEKVVWEPGKVTSVWSSLESMSHAVPERQNGRADALARWDGPQEDPAQEKAARAETGGLAAFEQISNLLAKQKVTAFRTMQSLIKQEDPRCREQALQEFEDRLERELEKLVHDIQQLPPKEEALSKLEADLEQSLRSNLRFLKVSKPENGEAKVDPRLVARLPVYEELIWILQTQTCYLAQMSTCVTGDEVPVFYRIVERIYGDPSERIRNLFLMMLRLTIDKETEVPGQKMEDIFNPTKSRAFHIFSRYALSEVHYKDLVHPYLKIERDLRHRTEELPNLLEAVKEASDRSETFALTYQDYKDALSEEEKRNKDEHELKTGWQTNLDKFREFLIQPFLRAIQAVPLPQDIRQVLAHTLHAVRDRHYQSDNVDMSIPQDLRRCEPLLRLFCLGVLGPLLRDTATYASKECFLRKSGEYLKGDALVASNLCTIAEFLEQMVEGSLSQKDQKIMISASKVLKPELLKYIKQQAEVVDDIETKMMMNTYLMHFDRSRQPITIATSDLMKLSNMLHDSMNQLRIKENDPIEEICQDIPKWSWEAVALAEAYDVQHNFTRDPRFLFTEPEVVLCQASRCLMPRRVSGAVAVSRLIKKYQPEESSENPRRVLEALLRDLEPIDAKNFVDLKEECLRLQAASRQHNPPNYQLIHSLNKGVRMIDELMSVEAHHEDVMQFMADSLVARDRHLQYLQQIDRGLDEIKRRKETYLVQLREQALQLEQAINFSLDLQLCPRFTALSDTANLKFVGIARAMASKRVFNPKQMKELGCSYAPIATYTVAQLKKMRVVAELHPPFSGMQKSMEITVRATTAGGVELVANIVQGKSQITVKTVNISDERLKDMTRALKNETTELGNTGEPPFVTCISHNLVSLITKLKEETA